MATSDTGHVIDIQRRIGVRKTNPSAQELAESLLRQYGTELLAKPDRREHFVTAGRRFGSRVTNPGSWHRGKRAALELVQALGLPPIMAGVSHSKADAIEMVSTFRPLPPLHDFQLRMADQIKRVLVGKSWEERRGLIWLPTGTGKTRLLVETLLLDVPLVGPRNLLLWVADREELCEQAVETFRHVWQQKGADSATRKQTGCQDLRIVRLWGGNEWPAFCEQPTVVVASIQALDAANHRDESQLAHLGTRCAAVAFDEAHHVVADSYVSCIGALGLGRYKNALGNNQETAPPLFGLTATPSRNRFDETEALNRRFQGNLIEPGPEFDSLSKFADREYVSRLSTEEIDTGYEIELYSWEQEQFDTFKGIPSAAVTRAGENPERTAGILEDLMARMAEYKSILLFACSVEHAKTMAEVLCQAGYEAAAVDGNTARPVRRQLIERFKTGKLRILVSCDLLTTGFDAPNVDCIAIARPTLSRTLYVQMVGRGLRGPKNGGTTNCTLLDYVDNTQSLGEINTVWRQFRDEFLGIVTG